MDAYDYFCQRDSFEDSYEDAETERWRLTPFESDRITVAMLGRLDMDELDKLQTALLDIRTATLAWYAPEIVSAAAASGIEIADADAATVDLLRGSVIVGEAAA